MNFKQRIFSHCHLLLEERIASLKKTLNDLGESAENETKSSVGDKHETARAHLHIEQENITKRLNEALDQKAALEKTDLSISSDQVIKGSLVKTNRGYLFMIIPLGKIFLDNESVICISQSSPIGMKLLGQKASSTIEVNGIVYHLEKIL
jgi:hypothetical protein